MSQNIALIRFSSLGDVVLITPVVRNLRREYPDARITVVTRRPYDELFYADPDVDRVVALGGKLDRDGLPGVEAAVQALSNERFDTVLDLQGNLKSWYLSRRIRAQKRFRYPKQRLARLKLVHMKKLAQPILPTVDRYNAVLPKVPADVRVRLPRVRLSVAARNWAAVESRRTRLPSIVTTVGAHPGAHWATKRWPESYFADCLARVAEKERARVFLFGSAPERDLLERIVALMPHIQSVIYCGYPIQRVGALVEHCDVFLANDSGLMHLAAALSVPTVSLFGPTHPGLGFAPQGPRNRVFFGYAHCSPCSLHGERPCYQRRRYCLERIEPAKVSEVMSEVLTEGKVVAEVMETAA
jgi:heptosyltransferase-2